MDDWPDWVRSAQDAQRPLTERHRSFGRLVSQFQDIAFGAAYGILGDTGRAEDAAQEAFIVAWNRLSDLRIPEAFPAWLGSLVRTACNRQTRRRIVPTVPLEENASFLHVSGPHASAEQRERSALVRDAVAALPESERLPVVLFHVAEYSRDEVAAFLGVSLITVKRRLASARGKLRERLLVMLQDDLEESRPSNDDMFATRVLAFTKLFRVLIDNGDSLVHALNQLAAQAENAAFRIVIEDLSQEIQAGNSLSRTMRKYPQWFAPEYIRAIREGEWLGQLEVVLAGLADGTYTVGEVLIDTPNLDEVRIRAYAEARSRAQREVLPEHLLLSLLKHEGCSALQELAKAGIDHNTLRAAVEEYLDRRGTSGETERFSDTARAIWGDTRQRAIAENADAIRTRHLLHALRDNTEVTAGRLLQTHGFPTTEGIP